MRTGLIPLFVLSATACGNIQTEPGALPASTAKGTVLELNQDRLLQGLQPDGRPCSLRIAADSRGDIGVAYEYLPTGTDRVTREELNWSEFDMGGDLPFLLATTGFLFGERNYHLLLNGEYQIREYIISKALGDEIARCTLVR